MTWDTNTSVNSWTQTNYAGTVTFATTYGSTIFTNFQIAGNCMISTGVWQHVGNANSQTYRLMVTVGQNLFLGSNATLNAKALGFNLDHRPGSRACGLLGGRHLRRHWRPLTKLPYGSITQPLDLGSGGDTAPANGGGAIFLNVTGSATLNGTINVDSADDANSGAGSGGSIYIRASSIQGGGTLTASCGTGGYGTRGRGAGGRIAIKLTNAGADFSSFTNAATVQAVTRGAYSGFLGGAGTIYEEDGNGNSALSWTTAGTVATTRTARRRPPASTTATSRTS